MSKHRHRHFALAGSAALAVTFAFTEPGPPEAPAAFESESNGFTTPVQFEQDRETFAEVEEIEEGLGPLYNAASCAACHANPVTGGISQVTELRAGHYDGNVFVDHPGGSLINDLAIDATAQERVMSGNEVRTQRTSLNILGDGYVECIDSNTLQAIASRQPFGMRGQVIQVPVLEANGRTRVGRFGWKNQHASLLSFAADAYLNEMGITSPLLPKENTSNGRPVALYDEVADPENAGEDIEAFARFMRSTRVPPRDEEVAATTDARLGDQVFSRIGCDACHVRNITTAPAGTVINQGAFTVPRALGGVTIHPFSDFLLHNVGTGDGIVQNGGQSTRNKVRTAPLWGLRTRSRLMHDGLSMTRNDAILRHSNEARPVVDAYRGLGTTERQALMTFLDSL